MENNGVIVGVELMAMGHPVISVEMKFDLSPVQCRADPDQCIEEVGTAIEV
jgi:hypothetical protein